MPARDLWQILGGGEREGPCTSLHMLQGRHGNYWDALTAAVCRTFVQRLLEMHGRGGGRSSNTTGSSSICCTCTTLWDPPPLGGGGKEWEMDSPQTFAASQGPGSGKGCWKRVAAWAAACPSHSLAGVVFGCLSVPLHLSAGKK